MKRRDEHAEPGRRPLVEERATSVLTGRTIEEVLGGVERPPVGSGDIAGATPAALPGAPEPQLATLVAEAPAGGRWLVEVKLDGYRLLARKDGGDVTLLTRRGNDWTERFPGVAAAIARLPVEHALLDGEVAIFDAHGRTDFGALQQAIADPDAPMVYVAFDLLHLGDHDLRPAPLEARKEALRRLLDTIYDRALRYSEHLRVAPREFHREACRLGLEGILCKDASAAYQGGRARTWLKVKCLERQELIIAGFTPPGGKRTDLGALLLAVREGDVLRYAGKVGTGFTARTLADLRGRLEPLRRSDSPLAKPPRIRDAVWVEPRLVAEVTFTGWTGDGRLRHPSFQGLREDKPPEEVVREVPKALVGEPRVAGVRLTHPDKVLYPDVGLTKRDLARYAELVGPRMLPGLAFRPLTLVRCPDGLAGDCFFQKAEGQGTTDVIGRVDVGAGEPYLMVRDVSSIVALFQLGVLELHVWGARAETLEQPDVVVLDLDPGPGVPWPRVVATALVLRDVLQDLGLVPMLRVTGGKGLHVVVPIEPVLGWDEVKGFTQALAARFARSDPKHYTDKLPKEHRKGRIFIDYLRNGRGATAIATWSPRRRADAPIAAPLPWDALDHDADGPPVWTVSDVLSGRLPPEPEHSDYESARRPLTSDILRAVK